MPSDKLKKCLDEGRKGGERHKGLKRARADQQLAYQHLKKALHNSVP